MPTRVERYLAHLHRWPGGSEAALTPFESDDREVDTVTVMTYRGLAEPGRIDGWTYGLSLYDNPAWTKPTPELFISVRATDIGWTMAIGDLADRLRLRGCPFTELVRDMCCSQTSDDSSADDFVFSA